MNCMSFARRTCRALAGGAVRSSSARNETQIQPPHGLGLGDLARAQRRVMKWPLARRAPAVHDLLVAVSAFCRSRPAAPSSPRRAISSAVLLRLGLAARGSRKLPVRPWIK